MQSPAGKAEKLKAVINAMKIEALCDRLDAIAYKKAGMKSIKARCKGCCMNTRRRFRNVKIRMKRSQCLRAIFKSLEKLKPIYALIR
jgi:hypothetical protein